MCGITGAQKLDTPPHPLSFLVNMAAAVAVFLGVATALGIDITKRPGETAMITIFMIAVAYLLVKGNTAKAPVAVIGRTMLMAVLVTLAFFALEVTAEALLGGAVAVYPPLNMATMIAIVLAVVIFGIVMAFSAWLPALVNRPAWQALYVHLKNGFYANTLFDRFIDAFRLAR